MFAATPIFSKSLFTIFFFISVVLEAIILTVRVVQK